MGDIYGILPVKMMKKSGDHGDITGIYDIIHINIYIYLQYMEGYIIMISGIFLIGDTIMKNRVAPTH